MKAQAHQHQGGHGALMVKLFLFANVAWLALPVFGIGTYRNGSGDLSFELWYLVAFLVLAFLLMHEIITPMPPKEDA
jgi:hypothetical protein